MKIVITGANSAVGQAILRWGPKQDGAATAFVAAVRSTRAAEQIRSQAWWPAGTCWREFRTTIPTVWMRLSGSFGGDSPRGSSGRDSGFVLRAGECGADPCRRGSREAMRSEENRFGQRNRSRRVVFQPLLPHQGPGGVPGTSIRLELHGAARPALAGSRARKAARHCSAT